MKNRFLVELDSDALTVLEVNALEERRQPRDQAAILIRRALGLSDVPSSTPKPVSTSRVADGE